jgi:ABC-type nitrate/sulfonate/bicarbonate transport system substrate-binding protein
MTSASAEPATVVASAFRPTLPLVLAEATGAFRRERLSVTVRTAASSDAQIAELIEGSIDVAHTALDNVVAWSRDAPVQVIGITDLGVAHELVAREPITSMAGLRGCTIGVDSPRSGFVVLLEAVLSRYGLDRDDYTIKPAGGLSSRAGALASGEVDACLLAGAALTAALASGHHRLLALREHFPSYPAIALVAYAPQLRGERRAVLARYVAALSDGLRAHDVDPAAVAAVLATDLPAAKAWLATEHGRMTDVVGDADAARRAIVDALLATGRIGPDESIDSFTELLMEEPGCIHSPWRGEVTE